MRWWTRWDSLIYLLPCSWHRQPSDSLCLSLDQLFLTLLLSIPLLNEQHLRENPPEKSLLSPFWTLPAVLQLLLVPPRRSSEKSSALLVIGFVIEEMLFSFVWSMVSFGFRRQRKQPKSVLQPYIPLRKLWAGKEKSVQPFFLHLISVAFSLLYSLTSLAGDAKAKGTIEKKSRWTFSH